MKLLRQLLPFILRFRPHRQRMLLGTLAGTIALASAVGLLSLSGWFISAAAFAGLTVAGAQAFNFFYPSVGVRLFAAARIAARYGERLITHDTTFRILKTLRVWFYECLEPLAPACLSRYRSGDILDRLVADIDALDNLYIRILSPAASAVLIVMTAALFLGLVDVGLAAVACAILLTAVVGVPWAASLFAMGTGQRLARLAAELRTTIIEGLQGLTDLIVFNAIQTYLERLERYNQQLTRLQRRMSHLRGASNALLTLLTGAALWAVLFLGAALVESGVMSGALLACVVLGVWAAFEAAVPLAQAFQQLGRTREAAERIGEITSATPAVAFPPHSAGRPATFDIALDKIHFRYRPDSPAVMLDFDLRITHGQRTALLGETGCGKSTLVHLLTRTWDPMAGSIRIGGRNLRDFAEDDLRATLTVISQQDHLFNATIADNLRIARPDASPAELLQALDQVRLSGWLDALPHGLDTWVGEGGRPLSGGQARRLVLARAILHDGPVWILDEPTEGLDKITEKAVWDALMRCAAGRTVLLITHRLVDFQHMDQIALMDRGRIVAIGTHRRLLRTDRRYRRMVRKMA